MPIDLSKESISTGEVFFEWEFPEFIQHERGKTWYLVAALIVGLMILYAVTTQNFMFAIIIIMAAMILMFTYRREPKILNIQLTEEGVLIETILYPYEEIKNFWMLYEVPDGYQLYFEFKNITIPRLSIPYFEDYDPNEIREFLLQYIPENENRDGEPISEVISKLLRL